MRITGHTNKLCLEKCNARKHHDLRDASYMHIQLFMHVNKYTYCTDVEHYTKMPYLVGSVSRPFHGYQGTPRSQEE